ncbi:hypothetical protein [Cyclobacterium xiamenense]
MHTGFDRIHELLGTNVGYLLDRRDPTNKLRVEGPSKAPWREG